MEVLDRRFGPSFLEERPHLAFMVKRLLPRAGEMKSDSADALACAICTAHHLPLDVKRGAA